LFIFINDINFSSSESNETASQDKWSLKSNHISFFLLRTFYLIILKNWISDNNTGEARDGTPDSVLVETVKKLNEAENLVVSLRQQLRVKNEGEHFSWIEHQMEQCLETDLQCNICYEMFIKVILLIKIVKIDNNDRPNKYSMS